MISVICVYNDTRAFEAILLAGLQTQTVKYQLVALRNTDGQFHSAAEAFNAGAALAQGKYLMFVHQDVELGSPSWLADVERLLDSIADLGVVGPAGMSHQGKTWAERFRGHICNCGQDIGVPLKEPCKVHTLDECLFITPARLFRGFDAVRFDGWHCYAADLCLTLQDAGYGTYAIPGYIYHRSRFQNKTDLAKYHRLLYAKHCVFHPVIYTTTGTLTARGVMLDPYLPYLYALYRRLFPGWLDDVKRLTVDCETLLDLGCGFNSPAQYLRCPDKTGVEIFKPYLIESQKKALHNRYIETDIRTLSLPPRSYDAVYASEVLEHMDKDEGYHLLERMGLWARKRVILTTPNGYIWQDDYHDNPFQEHKSGWLPYELQSLGYRVKGMAGLKQLRGYKAQIKGHPPFVWERISDVSQFATSHFPRFAFQLFAWKDIK